MEPLHLQADAVDNHMNWHGGRRNGALEIDIQVPTRALVQPERDILNSS